MVTMEEAYKKGVSDFSCLVLESYGITFQSGSIQAWFVVCTLLMQYFFKLLFRHRIQVVCRPPPFSLL